MLSERQRAQRSGGQGGRSDLEAPQQADLCAKQHAREHEKDADRQDRAGDRKQRDQHEAGSKRASKRTGSRPGRKRPKRIFEAVIDQAEVMQLADLSPRDIKHDNPEFRRHEELINFLERIYHRPVSARDTVTVVRFSQILDNPSGMTAAMKRLGEAQN
jgi:hypothetical protein